MNFVAKAVLAAGLMLGAAQAQAAVIFTFNQVGPFQHPPGPIAVPTTPINGQVIVSDQAGQNGFSYQINNTPNRAPYSQSSLSGLLSVQINNANRRNVMGGFNFLTLADLTFQRPFSSGFSAEVNLFGSTAAGLNGFIEFADTETQFRLDFTGTEFTGNFGADYAQGCTNPLCTLSGSVTTVAVPVPEPASLALFGMGLAGLGLIRRKRAA